MTDLLDHDRLERSWVVANSRMNRQRGLVGANSYEQEIGFSPAAFLRDRIAVARRAAWLDLCCGEGRALVAAARELNSVNQELECVGVDLTRFFAPCDDCVGLRLVVASLHHWSPDSTFDLITCVHGLHYVGDKLGLLVRASAWLAPEGILVAHLDPSNIHIDGHPLETRQFRALMPKHSFHFDARRSLLTISGRISLRQQLEYTGADDGAGPNLTGQDAVNSHYRT
jgi:trans-aconitate methyltransferase